MHMFAECTLRGMVRHILAGCAVNPMCIGTYWTWIFHNGISGFACRPAEFTHEIDFCCLSFCVSMSLHATLANPTRTSIVSLQSSRCSTHTYTQSRTRARAHTHTPIHAHTYTRTLSFTHTHTHTLKQTHTHTHAHTHTHTNTNTNTQMSFSLALLCLSFSLSRARALSFSLFHSPSLPLILAFRYTYTKYTSNGWAHHQIRLDTCTHTHNATCIQYIQFSIHTIRTMHKIHTYNTRNWCTNHQICLSSQPWFPQTARLPLLPPPPLSPPPFILLSSLTLNSSSRNSPRTCTFSLVGSLTLVRSLSHTHAWAIRTHG